MVASLGNIAWHHVASIIDGHENKSPIFGALPRSCSMHLLFSEIMPVRGLIFAYAAPEDALILSNIAVRVDARIQISIKRHDSHITNTLAVVDNFGRFVGIQNIGYLWCCRYDRRAGLDVGAADIPVDVMECKGFREL